MRSIIVHDPTSPGRSAVSARPNTQIVEMRHLTRFTLTRFTYSHPTQAKESPDVAESLLDMHRMELSPFAVTSEAEVVEWR